MDNSVIDTSDPSSCFLKIICNNDTVVYHSKTSMRNFIWYTNMCLDTKLSPNEIRIPFDVVTVKTLLHLVELQYIDAPNYIKKVKDVSIYDMFNLIDFLEPVPGLYTRLCERILYCALEEHDRLEICKKLAHSDKPYMSKKLRGEMIDIIDDLISVNKYSSKINSSLSLVIIENTVLLMNGIIEKSRR